MARVPMTPLRGVLLPTSTMFIGSWWIPGLRKDPVRTFFEMPYSWHDWKLLRPFSGPWGLSCITRKKRPQSKRYKQKVIDLIASRFRGEVTWHDAETAEVTKRYPLEGDNWTSAPSNRQFSMISFRSNVDRGYIGDPCDTLNMIRWGIEPEKSRPENETCSVGFCKGEQRWHGWSHRARASFGVGHVVQEGSLCTTSGWTDDYLELNPGEDWRVEPGFIAQNLDDCKRLALAFADAVG